MLLGTHRVAATTSNKCNRLYLRKKVERSTPPSADEQAARQRFAVVSAQVAARKKNVSTMSTDQAAFLAQKDQPGGKKTFVAYLWMVVGAAYDAEHPGE